MLGAWRPLTQRSTGRNGDTTQAQGHAEIERHIEAAKPSYGYYAPAEILASDDVAKPSRHNVELCWALKEYHDEEQSDVDGDQ